MVADEDVDLAAAARCLPLKQHEVTNDLEAVRRSIDHIAQLHEHRVAGRPFPFPVDQPGGSGNGDPGIMVAMQIADRDDARRIDRLGRSRADEQRGGHDKQGQNP